MRTQNALSEKNQDPHLRTLERLCNRGTGTPRTRVGQMNPESCTRSKEKSQKESTMGRSFALPTVYPDSIPSTTEE